MSGPVERLIHKAKSMIGKALLEAVTDTDEIQIVKISGMDNEVQSGLERIQEYGVTSNPPIGSECVVLYIGGNKDHGVVIKTDSGEYRVTGLNSGEVCFYSEHGQKILFNEDGEIINSNDGGETTLSDAGILSVGTGFDFVALSSTIDSYFAIVDTTLGSILEAVDTLTGSTLKDVYDDAKTASFGSTTIPSVASNNLKADKDII